MLSGADTAEYVPRVSSPVENCLPVTWLRWGITHGVHKHATVVGNSLLQCITLCAQLTSDLLAIAKFLA